MVPILPLLLFCMAVDPEEAIDRELFRQHHLEATDDAILQFFRQQTLDPARRAELLQQIQDLGSSRFAVRERASKRLPEFGPPARPFLQEALKVGDPEVRKRVEQILETIDSNGQSAVTLAASRWLARSSSPEVAGVLLDYLPFAGDSTIIEEVLNTLVMNPAAVTSERLRAARTAREPMQRAAAAFVLGRSADADTRRSVEPLLRDADSRVQLRAAQAFFVAKERVAIPTLIALLEDSSIEIRSLTDDLLRRLGDEESLPTASGEDTAATRKQYRAAWDAWWRREGSSVDLAKVSLQPALMGYTVGIEFNTGRVWEVGLDGQIRWEMQTRGPMDAHVLPNQRVLIAESNARMVTERDLKGVIHWQREFETEPINCRRLPNGTTFVGTRNEVFEVDASGKILKQFRLSDEYLHAVRRLPNGGYLGITGKGQIREMDRSGKLVRTINQQDEGRWGDVDIVGHGRYLVTNYGNGYVREIDASGKTLWEQKASGVCGAEALPGGRLLLAVPNRILVIDRQGNKVWESPNSTGSVRRAHRR